MRVLLALRGPICSGKSTYVRVNKLEEYVISMDKIRVALNGYSRDYKNRKYISDRDDELVWQTYIKQIETRMDRNEFIVVDGQNVAPEAITELKKLTKENGYRLYIKDLTEYYDKKEDKEEYIKKLISRNELRSSNSVYIPNEAIVESIDRAYRSRKNINTKSLIESLDEIYYRKHDLSKYKRLRVFGDIHGNMNMFKKALGDIDLSSGEDCLILLGDYVDRGIQNKEVVEYLHELATNPNVIMLRGNHEVWMDYHMRGLYDKLRYPIYREITMPEIEKIKDTHLTLRTISKSLHQIYYFNYNGNDILVNHAALPYWNEKMIGYDIFNMCKGFSDTDEYEKLWNEDPDAPIQIHGHINSRDRKFRHGKVFNLNSDIEFGGRMPVLTIYPDDKGKNELRYCNNIPTLTYDLEVLTGDTEYTVQQKNKMIMDIMKLERGVNTVNIGDDIKSYNYSDEVFENKDWSKLRVLARGLFYNTKTNEVVARAYDKFFNYGELTENIPESDLSFEEKLKLSIERWQELNKDKIEYPVEFYRKENGFLGLVSLVDGELFITSKSNAMWKGVHSESTTYPKLVWKQIKQREEEIKDLLSKLNSCGVSHTLVFEVIDVEEDPHISKYKDNRLFLLDIVVNKVYRFEKLPYEYLLEAANMIGVEAKKHLYTANNWEELLTYIEEIKNTDNIEGAVAVASNNFMFKIKTHWYLELKAVRGTYWSILGRYRSKMRDKLNESIEDDREKIRGNNFDIPKDAILFDEDNPLEVINIDKYRHKDFAKWLWQQNLNELRALDFMKVIERYESYLEGNKNSLNWS